MRPFLNFGQHCDVYDGAKMEAIHYAGGDMTQRLRRFIFTSGVVGMMLAWLFSAENIFAVDQNQEALLDKITKSYGLLDKQTEYNGAWKVGEMNGHRIAFQDVFGDIKIFVGRMQDEVAQIPDIILYKMDPSAPQETYPFKLNEIPGLQGTSLASQYAIRTPPGEPQIALLNLPAVKDGVPKLISTVSDITIFEAPAVQVYLFKKGTTQETIDEDLRILLSLQDALQKAKNP